MCVCVGVCVCVCVCASTPVGHLAGSGGVCVRACTPVGRLAGSGWVCVCLLMCSDLKSSPPLFKAEFKETNALSLAPNVDNNNKGQQDCD